MPSAGHQQGFLETVDGETDTLFIDGIAVEKNLDTAAGADGSSGRIPGIAAIHFLSSVGARRELRIADLCHFIRQTESAWSADSGRSAAPQKATLSNLLNT